MTHEVLNKTTIGISVVERVNYGGKLRLIANDVIIVCANSHRIVKMYLRPGFSAVMIRADSATADDYQNASIAQLVRALP
tara:strand:- start:12 stop:251 length:240 start_codon:yes stop_codon:yes gene_type:complete